MKAPHDQQISSFLQAPVNRALVDHYDPGRNLVRHMVASDDRLTIATFIDEIAASRHHDAAAYFGDKADGRDVIYADALDVGIAHLGLVKVIGISPGRRRQAERLAERRARSLAHAIVMTTVEEHPAVFDDHNIPLVLEGYKALRRTIAIVGHAHDLKTGKMQMRKNGKQYWTHPDMTGEFMHDANIAAGMADNLGKQGAEQLAAGAHDADEDNRQPDSSHWATVPTLVSPLCVRYVAEATRAKNPLLIAAILNLMARTKDMHGIRMDYSGGYIPRGLTGLTLPNEPRFTFRREASDGFAKLKNADQSTNENDPPHPMDRRVNEDYVLTHALTRRLYPYDSPMMQYLDNLQAHTLADTERHEASIASIDSVEIAERAEHYHKVAMRTAA